MYYFTNFIFSYLQFKILHLYKNKKKNKSCLKMKYETNINMDSSYCNFFYNLPVTILFSSTTKTMDYTEIISTCTNTNTNAYNTTINIYEYLLNLITNIDLQIFVIVFLFSFVLTLTTFIVILLGNLIEHLGILIKKVNKIVSRNIKKEEIIYIIEEEDQNKKCISPKCEHELAKYVYVNTTSNPYGVVYFCEKHYKLFFKNNNIPFSNIPLPEFF